MAKIFLYNTLTCKKEEFRPINEGEVLFYQCGPTVYWTQHIGNLRAAVMGWKVPTAVPLPLTVLGRVMVSALRVMFLLINADKAPLTAMLPP